MKIIKMSFKPSLVVVAAALSWGFSQASVALPVCDPIDPTKNYMLHVIDRSGTMQSGSPSRFDKAKTRAITDVLDQDLEESCFSIWTFNGSSYTEHTDWVDGIVALNTLNTGLSVVPAGSTPLAMTLCDAVDALTTLPIAFSRRFLYAHTDGLENSTPFNHPCQGFSSTLDYPTYEADSWQGRVYDKIFPGSMPPPVTLFARVFDDYITYSVPPSSGMTISMVDGNVAGKAGKNMLLSEGFGEVLSASQSQFAGDTLYDFWGNLARDTGGSLVVIDDASGTSNIYGDVDQSGCVDYKDLNIIFDNFGQSDPQDRRADVNKDGIVDYDDYLIVSQSIGEGCTQKIK